MGSSILSNNVVQSMIRTLSSFLSDTYKAVRYNTGDEWMRMTAAEKTLIVLLSADMVSISTCDM